MDRGSTRTGDADGPTAPILPKGVRVKRRAIEWQSYHIIDQAPKCRLTWRQQAPDYFGTALPGCS